MDIFVAAAQEILSNGVLGMYPCPFSALLDRKLGNFPSGAQLVRHGAGARRSHAAIDLERGYVHVLSATPMAEANGLSGAKAPATYRASPSWTPRPSQLPWARSSTLFLRMWACRIHGIVEPSADDLVITVHGDTTKDCTTRSGWPDGTVGNSNTLYVYGAGYLAPAGSSIASAQPERLRPHFGRRAPGRQPDHGRHGRTGRRRRRIRGLQGRRVQDFYNGLSMGGLVNATQQ